MRESEKQKTPSDDDARDAMVREQLGGPADYDESGGTGLGGGQSAGGRERADADTVDADGDAGDAVTRGASGDGGAMRGAGSAGADEQQQRRSR